MPDRIDAKEKHIKAKFKPRARLLLQLGDQLIKNESIALVELAKNAYDADASKVDISMENVDDPQKGCIIIEDDGTGMTPDIVENVWLEPGSDYKSELRKKGITSKRYNRLPIGEKGIGRFAAHKLGDSIELTTKASNSNEIYVQIDWRKVSEEKYLDDVHIKIIERSVPFLFLKGRTGTKISISNLRKKWDRTSAREVKRSITALSTPFSKNDTFIASFDICDKSEWFDGLLKWEDVMDYSLFNFRVVMEGSNIVEFKYEFTPWNTMTKLDSRFIDETHDYISLFRTIRPQDDKKKKDNVIDLSVHKIGKVLFEGYIFSKDSFVLKLGLDIGLTDKKGFQKYLKDNGGIRVFRDGLRVYDYGETGNDWLGLDYRRFQNPGRGISNNMIIGAVSLTSKDSDSLMEKTNREGFVENDAYRDFCNAILHSISLIEALRHEDKLRLNEKYGATPKSSPVLSTIDEVKAYLESNVKDSDVKKQIISYLVRIEDDFKKINEDLLKAAGAGLSMSVVVHEVEKIVYEIKRVLVKDHASERVLKLVEHLASLIDGYAELVRRSSPTIENIKDVIEQAIFNTEYRLNVHKIQIEKRYKSYEGHLRVKIAKNLLIGTLMNLLDNSIYWLEKKSEEASRNNEVYRKKIYIDLHEEEGFLIILVADNGTGFLSATDNLIEPFVSNKPGGMGLGLHIANRIMESQKGRLFFPDFGDYNLPNDFGKGAVIALALRR